MLPKYEPTWFEAFYALYPRKTNRAAAVKAWDKLKPDRALCDVMHEALLKQIKCVQWQDPQHIPHPATWLNGQRWLDELPESISSKPESHIEMINGQEVRVYGK